MRKSILIECVRQAREKVNRHPHKIFPHFSFIVQDNSICECGINRDISPPIHFGYNRKIKNMHLGCFGPKRHSEVDAYMRVKGKMNHKKPFEMVNIRLNREIGNQLKMSCPCFVCQELMPVFGCKCVYFSTNEGTFEKMSF